MRFPRPLHHELLEKRDLCQMSTNGSQVGQMRLISFLVGVSLGMFIEMRMEMGHDPLARGIENCEAQGMRLLAVQPDGKALCITAPSGQTLSTLKTPSHLGF